MTIRPLLPAVQLTAIALVVLTIAWVTFREFGLLAVALLLAWVLLSIGAHS